MYGVVALHDAEPRGHHRGKEARCWRMVSGPARPSTSTALEKPVLRTTGSTPCRWNTPCPSRTSRLSTMSADGLRACTSFDEHRAETAGAPYYGLDAVPLDHAVRVAADEVEQLVSELEPTLNAHQRRLLHQVRLAAESLGAVRVTSLM